MYCNGIPFDRIGERFSWSPMPWTNFFGIIFVAILIENVLYFLKKWWTKSNGFSLDDQQTSNELVNVTEENDHGDMAWNKQIKSYMVMGKNANMSVMFSMEPSRLLIVPLVIDWKDFVPHKYLCSCQHKNVYSARKPITVT